MPIEYLDDIEEDITEAADTTPVEQPPVAGISEPVAPEPSGEFGGRIEYIEEEPLEIEPPRDNSWDTLRGFEVSMRQVPQLAYGVAGLVGETAEQLTGYGESLRDFGFKGYQDWAQSMEPISKETDDVTVAWQRAKEGDVGALVDWAQYGIGYALGQLGETAAVAVLGGVAGGAAGAAGGPTAVPAAAGGAVAAAAGKQGFKALAQNLVEKAIANQATKIVTKQAQKEGVELTAEQLAKRASQEAVKRQAGKEIGSNAAIFANAVGMQLGSIYGSAEEQARAEGRELTGVDLARIWGTGVATGGIEGVVDKFGLDLLKGKLSDKLPAGRLAGAAVAGGIGTVGEAATEAVQTVGERFGAGKDILSDEAINEYINASALGGLGGGAIGGVGGFISGNPKENAAAKAKVSSEANKEIAPASAETVARQADAVIAETVQETPEQRVARLQEEATAAAGIELEEEAPVSGLPPQPVTTPVEPTAEGEVAPVEPVVEPAVAEPQPVAEVAPADQPSPNLAPRAEAAVEARPVRQEGEPIGDFRNRKDAWDEQYGTDRRGGRTHNDDGTPYQPTVFDETISQVNASGVIGTDEDAMSAAIGTRSELEAGNAVKDLVNAGWVWDAAQNRMVNPQNPEQRPSDGLVEARQAPAPVTPTAPAVTPPAEVAPVPQLAPIEVEPQVAAQKAIDASRLSGSTLGMDRANQGVEQAREVAYDAKREASLPKTPIDIAIQTWEVAGNETKYGEPKFASGELGFAVSGGYDKSTNEVKLSNNPREFSSTSGDSALTPRSVVRHELGHWALFNAADNDLVRRLFEWADTADKTGILNPWHGGKAGVAYPKTKFDSRDELVSEAYSIWKSGGSVPNNVIPLLQDLDALIPTNLQNEALQFADSHSEKLGERPSASQVLNADRLRRVVRAEQAPEDVPSLVDAGLVEVYKDQPVLTEAGIAQLPEAERPRLNPEARKIQIDTGSNEVVAEAIAKNLRIGVDQVGTGVRMPAGWTLVEDIYVPPAPQEVVPEAPVAPKVEPEATEEEPAKVDPIDTFKGGIRDSGFKYLTYSDFRRENKTQDWEKEGGVTIDESYYPTAVVGDTRVAFGTNGLYVFKNQVKELYESDVDENGNTIFTIQRIVTPEDKRGQGSASKALTQITDAADKAGLTLQLQPAVISTLVGKGGKALNAKQLVDWYKRNGFVQKFDGSDAVLIRKPVTSAVPEVIPPRPADVEPEPAAEQELQSVVDKYQTSEPTARMILANLNFEAKEAGVIPDGWVVETIGGIKTALSPVFQKTRRDIQVAIRKFTIRERGALSARFFKEGWINEDQSKEYLREAISQSSQERVTAAEAEANERFDALVERIVGENRANISSVVGEVSKPTIDLEAEEQARAEKPSVSPSEVLDPNEIEFMSARQALKKLAESNVISFSDSGASGKARWRYTGKMVKPQYVRLQEAASVLAKTNLRTLDAERINISGDKSGRANRAYAGDIFIPRTEGSDRRTAYLEPWVLLHEVGHTLTSDAFQKYVPDKGLIGADYYKQLKDTLKNKKVPREVRRAITLYIDTIKALGFEKEYFKKGGLASNNADRGLRNAAARTSNKLINPFTGNEITRDDMYALADMHEFYAQAWNSESFQDILKQIKVEPQRSAFQKFVEIVKDIFGFESDTMAYAVIDTSLRLASLEAPTDTGATIESRIKTQKEFRAVKELPRTKMRWTNFGNGKYGGDRVKMSRNKFVKLGYDMAHFTITKGYKGVFGGGGNQWSVRVSIEEFYSKGKKANQLLPQTEIFVRTFDSKATAEEFAERLASDVNGMVNEKYGALKKGAPQPPTTRGKPAPRPRFAPAPEVRESRREDAIPTFSEGSPEATTLSTMAAAMAKVDGASEAKPNPENKPTYKISEIASVWMDQGGDVRQLQDLISENTNLTPTNAAKVANAIAKQYDIQQSIATAFIETQTGLSVEALPEGVTLPKEVDPDRPRPVMQRLFDVFMGVRVKPVKITGDEKALLKSQIRLKAAANRAAKQEQQRTADEVVEIIKSMELRGPVRPKQAQALAKRAAKVIWTSEKSMESFVEYAAKVVENANYDADLREAKAAQKRAKELSKQKRVAMSPQRLILQQIGNVAVNKLDDPRMFAEMINYYLRGFKDVRSPDYVVVPDEEITGYISQLETESVKDQAEVERETNERLARKYDLDPNTIPELMSLINIIEEIEGRENREALESILTDKAIETQDGLRGYDTTALTNTQKKLVESMLGVDLKSINNQEKQMFIRIANNMIYNNQTNGAEYFVATAKGQQNARKAAQDSKMIQRNKAWIPLIPSFGSLKLQETLRNFSLELQSVADTFRNVFGKDFMAKAYEMMGMLDLNEGFTKANNTIDEIQDLMAEFHQGNEKTYGDAARNQDGILSEGVAGFLIQEFPFKDEATSIQQRRNLINEYIANARESRQKDRVAMADRVEAILNKVDGASVQEILNNMKREYRPNYDSLMWYKDVLFPKYKDFLKQFDENFNDQANNYDSPNYLPIAFTSAGPALALGPEDVSIANSISLQPKQSVYTIKRQDYTTLPKDKDGNPKEIEFNLRRTAFNSLSDQINKAYTNPAWQQIFAFMKTPESIEFFGDKANRDFFVDRLNRLRASRARRGSVSGGALEKALDSFSIISRKLGTGIALGGVFQWIKQPPDQLLTALGSGGRADLLAKNIAPSTQKAARELLNQFSIGRRGDSSAGYKYINQMEGHQSRMERYFSESKWEQAKEQGGKIADVWMVALKKSDFISASAAWMTYYEGELNKNDIKIDDWAKEAELVKTDPVRRQAAAYAEQMTDIYQGSSDPTSMATFAQSGKTGWENFTKALLVPFNSFAIQQRMRLYSDARDALNGTSGGKGGLAGTIGGLILFHTTKRFVLPVISGGTAAILYGMLGVDMEEPDEEKQKEMADRNWRQFLADITGNLLVGGTPQLVENRTIEAFNYASYMVGLQLESETVMDENGEIMSFDKYSKERSPFYRYKSYDNAMSLGMFDIGFDQAKETALQTKMLMDRDEMEMYTPEEQRLLYFSALSEWLYLMRLNDTDFARIVKKARRDMIKAAEEREKELARIRAGR